jgi:hypothetical protein
MTYARIFKPLTASQQAQLNSAEKQRSVGEGGIFAASASSYAENLGPQAVRLHTPSLEEAPGRSVATRGVAASPAKPIPATTEMTVLSVFRTIHNDYAAVTGEDDSDGRNGRSSTRPKNNRPSATCTQNV